MKLATLLAALTGIGFAASSPVPPGLQAVEGASEDHKPFLFWEPPNSYHKQIERKALWEKLCHQALTRVGCAVGKIISGETRVTKPNGNQTSYIKVEGMGSKRLRVFKDGSSEDLTQHGWTDKDRYSIVRAKRRKKEWDGQNDQRALLRWNPADAYGNQANRREFWEKRCGEALAKIGCSGGIIHKGETRVTKDGLKTSYVRVEGTRSMDPGTDKTNSKELRVYQDASSEEGWSEHDRYLMVQSKYRRDPPRKKANLVDPDEARTSPQAATQHRISWNPPHAYETLPLLRKAYEKACSTALAREGCNYAIMHKGRHHLDRPVGTKLRYLRVTAGKDDSAVGPGWSRNMMLFENGSSEWYAPGPLPRRETRTYVEGKTRFDRLRNAEKRPVARPRKNAASSQATTQASSTPAAHPGPLRGPAEPAQAAPQEQHGHDDFMHWASQLGGILPTSPSRQFGFDPSRSLG